MTEARDFTPRPIQKPAIAHLLNVPRCALWKGMGGGKTSDVLAVLDILYNLGGETHPTLILAPKRVAAHTWPDEARKWRQFQSLEVSPVLGTPAQRLAALKRDVPIFTINYDNIPWLVEHYGRRWPFEIVVADEATRLKSFRLKQGGIRAAALREIAHRRTRHFIELTGTPSPNGLKDLWGQMWMLDKGDRLGLSYSDFIDRWFQRVPSAENYMQLRPLAHAQAEIQNLLKDICLTLDAADWFDLEKPIVNVIRVDMPAKARAIYRDMEKEMFAQIEQHSIEAFGAAAKSMKCLQLANGAAYVGEDNKEFVEVHDAKLQALESVLEEAGGAPVLVAYHFKSDLARLQRAFPDAINIATAEGLRRAKKGEGRLWLGHPASVGHGVDGLQEHCNIVVFFGHWWNLEEHDQFIERVGPVRQAQAGFKRPVFVHYIVAADTVDEIVMERRSTKREVQDLLLSAMKRRLTR